MKTFLLIFLFVGVAAILKAVFDFVPEASPDSDVPPAHPIPPAPQRAAILEKYVMAGAAIPSTETALVPVKSAWLSKINWAAIGSSVVSLATANVLGLDAATQAQVLVVVNLATNVLTFVFRTWFNRSVTPSA